MATACTSIQRRKELVTLPAAVRRTVASLIQFHRGRPERRGGEHSPGIDPLIAPPSWLKGDGEYNSDAHSGGEN